MWVVEHDEWRYRRYKTPALSITGLLPGSSHCTYPKEVLGTPELSDLPKA